MKLSKDELKEAWRWTMRNNIAMAEGFIPMICFYTAETHRIEIPDGNPYIFWLAEMERRYG